MRFAAVRALASLSAALLMTGCDPGVGVTFKLAPPGPEVTDTAVFLNQASGITCPDAKPARSISRAVHQTGSKHLSGIR